MSVRSSVRVTNHAQSNLAKTPREGDNRDDGTSIHSPLRRVRPATAETIIEALNDQERALVADVGRLRVVSGGQLGRLHFPSTISGKRQARRVLQHLVHQRVLTRLGRTIGGKSAGSTGFVYSLDVVGQRLLDPLSPVRRPWLPSHAFVKHAVMVAECYTQLRETEQQGAIELLDFDAEPACWRPFVDRRGAHRILKPDSFVRVGVGEFEDLWYLECDGATEDLPRIARKNQAYIGYWQTGKEAVYPKVLWVASRAGRANALAACASELPDEHQRLFAVCDLNSFVGIVTGAGEEGKQSNE
ncbi:MAG: replication-relaxation family protein [Acidimicrobiales bacterium]|nr:replication-relaxation family protein [Acidimicrobiales bacterium]